MKKSAFAFFLLILSLSLFGCGSAAPSQSTINLKVMGILFSAFAAAQGSPFWFDILNRVVNIRGSGKSPDEKTK